MGSDNSRGILLISFGIDYDCIAPYCAESIRKFSNILILVHTNIPRITRNKKWNEISNVKFVMHELKDSDNRIIKTQLSMFTEFSKTLYIDVDSEVLSKRFLEPFDILNKYDVVGPEWKTYSLQQINLLSKTKSKFKNFLFVFNKFKIQKERLIAGGLCYFNKSYNADLFFIDFHKLWKQMGCKEDMPALNGAMFKHNKIVMKISNVDYNNYNSKVICSQHNSLIDYSHMRNFTRRRCNETNGNWEYCMQGRTCTFVKPRIAFIYDIVGWAFYNMSHCIKKELSKYYEIDIIAYDRIKDHKAYDAIICFSPNVIPRAHSKNIICGISSHVQKNIDKLYKYTTVFSNDISLYELINHRNKYYIPNGINTSFFDIKKHRSVDRVVHIGAVGSVSRLEHKGFTRIKEIVSLLNKTDTHHVYKDCSLFVDVKKHILNQDELLNYYSSIDIFVVSSISETGPNPLLEAMSCGVPSVCNDVGLVSLLITNGENGFIVDDCNDTEEYAKQIKILSSDKHMYSNASKLSRASVIDYDWSVKATGFKDMIDSFLLSSKEERTAVA